MIRWAFQNLPVEGANSDLLVNLTPVTIKIAGNTLLRRFGTVHADTLSIAGTVRRP
jgi:hypothetical protein